MRKADVIIPTFKPGDKLEKLLRRLLEQSVPVDRVIIMNTEEKYWDAERFESLFEGEDTKLTVCHIRQSEFDHGRTRHEGILKSDADVCICMTHDCVPYDRNLVKELLEALEEDEQKEFLEEMISPKLYTMFVTPKDVDETVRYLSFTISEGLNLAFSDSLIEEDRS